MAQIKELFMAIEDTRHDGYVKYILNDVLKMVMSAAICGITDV